MHPDLDDALLARLFEHARDLGAGDAEAARDLFLSQVFQIVVLRNFSQQKRVLPPIAIPLLRIIATAVGPQRCASPFLSPEFRRVYDARTVERSFARLSADSAIETTGEPSVPVVAEHS